MFCAKHAGLCLICVTNYKSFEQNRHLSHDVNKGKYQIVFMLIVIITQLYVTVCFYYIHKRQVYII